MSENGKENVNSALLAVLATGATIERAATDTGLSPRTISRRLRNPKFRAALDRIKDAVLGQVISKLTDASARATDTLTALLDCDSPATRLGAARTILELSVSMRSTIEFSARLTALESKTNGKQ